MPPRFRSIVQFRGNIFSVFRPILVKKIVPPGLNSVMLCLSWSWVSCLDSVQGCIFCIGVAAKGEGGK